MFRAETKPIDNLTLARNEMLYQKGIRMRIAKLYIKPNSQIKQF